MYISRKELYDKLWSIGQMKTAKELNITSSKLIVVCADYDIPLPPRAFWYGRTEQFPLPNPESDVQVCLAKKPNPIIENVKKSAEQNRKPVIPSLSDCFKFYPEDEWDKLQAAFNALHMEPALSPTPHEEIQKYWAYQENGKGMKKLQPTLKFKTSLREIEKEVFIFIDQLLKAFDYLGARIYSDQEATKIEFGEYTFALTFKLPAYKNNLRENLTARKQAVATATVDEPIFIWKGILILQIGVADNNSFGQFKSQTITQHMDESLNALLKRTFVEMVGMAGLVSGVGDERVSDMLV